MTPACFFREIEFFFANTKVGGSGTFYFIPSSNQPLP
jgi:hypothetical protein